MSERAANRLSADVEELDDGTRVIVLVSPWNLSFELREVPGTRYIGKRKRWEMPLSWSSCVMLRSVFGQNITIGQGLKAWAREERSHRIDPSLAIRELIELPEGHDILDTGVDYLDGANDHDGRLYPYQLAGREFLVTARQALLGDEQGSGKTIQVLAALRRTDAYPAIVICPNSVKEHWANEVRTWLPEATPIVMSGSAKQKRDALKTLDEVDRAVVIINIESVRIFSRLAPYGNIRLARCTDCDKYGGSPAVKKGSCEVHAKELNEIPFRTAVSDEAHRSKDPRTKQTRAIWSVFHNPSVEYRWALTGTPMANNPGDIWSIMHAVAPGDFQSRSKFIDRYALLSWNAFGAMDIVGLRPDTRDEFHTILSPRFRRMLKSVVLPQLPPKVRSIRTVEMSPKQRKAYDELSSSLVTRLDDGTLLVARSNLSAAIRLLQLSSSYCEVELGDVPEDPSSWTVTPTEPSPKVDELVELIRENEGHSIAVSAEHRKLLELAEQRLIKEGIPCVTITGAVSTEDRQRNLELFQAGKIKVIMFTYKAGGVGLTMSAADILVRLQRSWSLVDNLQGEDRVHRIGSEVHESVNIIDVVTANTIETQQCLRLHSKSQRLEEIVRDRDQLVKHGLPTDDIDNELERLETAFLGEA